MALEVSNFSLGINQWELLDGGITLSADVIDDTYIVVVSGTYFLHNDDQVSTLFSAIPNGYRVSYSPSNLTSSGTIYIKVHAQNNNSEIYEKTYELLYGYRVSYEEQIDWGPKKDIHIQSTAMNTSLCPNIEGAAFYFQTRDLPGFNLPASISAIQYKDLNATLYPQSTFFFYGKTYSVTISGVKDYHGNEMPPYTFSFTIKDES